MVIVHELVPKHMKLKEKEVRNLLDRYNISKKQLPKILISDPAISSLGVKVGDVIKIIRKSPTNKQTFFYRVVV